MLHSRRNILVSGGTGSGKTTLLNALIELLPVDERIVAIEDTLELRIERSNCVRFEARGFEEGAVTIRDLVRHAGRRRASLGSHLPGGGGRHRHGDSHDAPRGETLCRGSLVRQGLRSRREPLARSACLAAAGGAFPAREGLVRAFRESSPQARRHFTRFDQVDRLARAALASPDRGFMARLMMLCSLPRTNPGRRLQYKRVNAPTP